MELTVEDDRVIARLGISREKFIASRKAEQDRAAARAAARLKPAPTAPKPKAEMGGPCPSCGHSADHVCTAANCKGQVPASGPSDRMSASEVAIADRLGVSHAEFLKARRAEIRA